MENHLEAFYLLEESSISLCCLPREYDRDLATRILNLCEKLLGGVYVSQITPIDLKLEHTTRRQEYIKNIWMHLILIKDICNKAVLVFIITCYISTCLMCGFSWVLCLNFSRDTLIVES